MVRSILLVGVGGQGTLLASKILTNGLMQAGYDVKMSEIHGMSQRGGSVSSQVRYGERVDSPVIEIGGADILVSFEKMEALRWLPYLDPKGRAVVNDFELPSSPILTGKVAYPRGVLDELKSKVDTTVVNASEIARNLGSVRSMNLVLFGALVKGMGLTDIDWQKVIRENVRKDTIEVNLKAFQAGMDQIG
jgi:indolepyruvate ferredoxin oxidoreductase beta subunit